MDGLRIRAQKAKPMEVEASSTQGPDERKPICRGSKEGLNAGRSEVQQLSIFKVDVDGAGWSWAQTNAAADVS